MTVDFFVGFLLGVFAVALARLAWDLRDYAPEGGGYQPTESAPKNPTPPQGGSGVRVNTGPVGPKPQGAPRSQRETDNMTTPKEAAQELNLRWNLMSLSDVADFVREQREAGRREGYAEGNRDAWHAVEIAFQTPHNDHPDEDSPYYDGMDDAIRIIKSIGEDQLNQMNAGLHEFGSLGFTRGPGPLPSGTEILKCVHCGAQATGDGDGNLGDGWKNSECPKRDKEEP